MIKTLLERRLIRIAGRKQVVGKPFLYATTREFLLHFGLGLGDLPPLEEIEETFGGRAARRPAVRPRGGAERAHAGGCERRQPRRRSAAAEDPGARPSARGGGLSRKPAADAEVEPD